MIKAMIEAEGEKMISNDKVQELGNNSSFEEFIRNGTVLVDFYAEWCMPCLIMHPILDEMAEKFKGKIKFAKLNVDDAQDIAQRFYVSSIPNMILFKDGKQIDRFIGAQNPDDFEEKLEKFA